MGEVLRGTPLLPPPKPLTVFCSFLDPSFILGRIWSQTHQVKPGGSSGVSPEPSHQHGAGGSWGSALAGLRLFSPTPHSPKHPQRLPPAPGDPPSTDQEGITIFMLRVTGIRGLQGQKLGGVSSKVRETNGGRGRRTSAPGACSRWGLWGAPAGPWGIPAGTLKPPEPLAKHSRMRADVFHVGEADGGESIGPAVPGGREKRREIRAGLSTPEDTGEFEGFPPGQLFSKAANARL